MAEKFVFSNFAVTTLREAIGPDDTELVINVDDVERFPDLTGGGKFPLILLDDDDNAEIVYVVLLGSDGVAQVERGREGTVAQSWLAGTLCRHTMTAASLVAMGGLSPKGTWSSATQYVPLDIVVHSNISYIAVNESLNSVPSLANSNWMVVYQPPGAASTALAWQDRWNSGTTYAVGHLVEYNGKLWRSNLDPNLNSTPANGNPNWTHIGRASRNTDFKPIINCTGTDNYAATITDAESPYALYDGLDLRLRFANPNTGPSTLTLTVGVGTTLAAVQLRMVAGQSLPEGFIRAGQVYDAVYDAGNNSILFVNAPGASEYEEDNDAALAALDVRIDSLEAAVPAETAARAAADSGLNTRLTVVETAHVGVGHIIPGMIFDWAGTGTPSKYLPCDGAAVSRTTYAALFAAIGTTWGIGNGVSTFNVPDFRGRVTAGVDGAANRLTTAGSGVDGDTLGAAGGSETHTLTIAQMPSHTHQGRKRTFSGGGNAGIDEYDGSVPVDLSPTGGGQAHPNVQPTIIVNKIIYAGV